MLLDPSVADAPRMIYTVSLVGDGPGKYVRAAGSDGEAVPVAEGRGLTWSPDDTRLAFRDPRGRLLVLDLDTGLLEILFRGGGADWRPF